MANMTLTPSTAGRKAEQQIAAINALLENPSVHLASPDASTLLASKPETMSDLLACLMALHSEMFDFTSYNLLKDLPAAEKRILDEMEQRWSSAIRSAIACLSKQGATVPPAFGEFFSTQLIQ